VSRGLPTSRRIRLAALFAVLLASSTNNSQGAARDDEPDLVDVRAFDKTILVELRYAGTRNIAGRALYPPQLPALVRPSVARKLAHAQALLRTRGYGLKIWDAYRPPDAHLQLWQLSPDNKYVADPKSGGSLHTWGVAVDATLVDAEGNEVAMPTDFDEFKPAAMLRYAGTDELVRRNLRMLQAALARAGFYGLRTEWWHFVVKDWKNYSAINEIELIKRNRAARAVQPAAASPAPVSPRGSANNSAAGASSRYAR
jgi:zinc D-Ala-D-Ala dipeptidase